jgi:hypothetical protein
MSKNEFEQKLNDWAEKHPGYKTCPTCSSNKVGSKWPNPLVALPSTADQSTGMLVLPWICHDCGTVRLIDNARLELNPDDLR